MQPRITGQIRIGEKLSFQLKSRLLGSEQNQRQALWVAEQRLANFFQAQERFSRAGRTEKKSRLHPFFVAQNAGRVKEETGCIGASVSFDAMEVSITMS